MAEIDWGLAQPTPNFVGQYQNAFNVGRDMAKQAISQKALANYSTNPQGAVSSLMQVDPDQAMHLQQFSQGQRDRSAKIAGAQAYAGGDVQGAKTALAQTGNLDDEVAIDQHIANLTAAQREQAAKVAETTGNIAAGLQTVPDDLNHSARAAILQHMAPSLIAQGFTQQQIDNVDLSDNGLTALRNTVMTQAERLQQATLAETVRHNQVEERMPKPVAVGADQTLINTNPLTPGAPASGSPPGATAPAPAPSGPAYDQIAQVASQAGATPPETSYLQRTAQIESSGNPTAQNGKSTGLFQFHPDTFHAALPNGDITSPADQTKAALITSRQYRQTLQSSGLPTDDGSVYLMHQQGPAAGKALLTAAQSQPSMSAVAALTPVYGNAQTAQQAIVNNGGTADMTAAQFVQMWQGKFGGGGQTAPAPSAAAPANAAPGSPQVMYQGANAAGAQALSKLAASGVSGQAVLTALPPAQAAQVKAIAEGRMPFPSGMALKTPYWQSILSAVSQYDPTFNSQDAQARARTRLDFTSGQSARSMTALATAINHGDEVLKTGDALGNVQIPLVGNAFNALKNTAAAAGGDPRVGNFKAAAQTYLTEVAKVLQGGPPHEGELNKAQQILNDANSPAQIHDAVKTIAGLLMGRFGPLIDQYNQGMGTIDSTPPSIKPNVWASFQRQLGNDPNAAAPAAPGGAPASGQNWQVVGVR